MLRYEQGKDVIHYVRQLHGQLAECYATHRDEAPQERMKMLLDYLSRHERQLEATLASYEKDAAVRIRNTWFQYVPSDTVERTLQNFEIRADGDIDEVISRVLEFDNAILNLYREVISETDQPEVKAVFQNLLDMESGDSQMAVFNLGMLQDI